MLTMLTRPFREEPECVSECSKSSLFRQTLTGSDQSDGSLAWAELYLTLAALVQQITFQFVGAKAEDFQCASDQFIIGTKGKGVLKAWVRLRE